MDTGWSTICPIGLFIADWARIIGHPSSNIKSKQTLALLVLFHTRISGLEINCVKLNAVTLNKHALNKFYYHTYSYKFTRSIIESSTSL